MKENKIFDGCKEIAKDLEDVRKRRIQIVKEFDNSIKSNKKLLFEKIRDNLMTQCSKREKEFLGLKMADGEKLLNYLIRQFDVSESIRWDDRYTFKVKALQMRFTDSELNNNEFYFDSGKTEIRKIVNSIFSEKLGIDVGVSFDQNDKYCLLLLSGFRTYVSI